MSSLDKLAIRGIRSFDHNDLSVMAFYTPLTVIVGHNGSGKTTIIECLKYATTGDLPPNTKGGAFVHDPSIAGTAEVKAQVKLRFVNNQKEKMLVERRLQVTRKKVGGNLTMKTLEGTISYVDEHNNSSKKTKRTSLSTKCANLDEEVPNQLGVSKAILENVIFCHQEESNWPLSAPADLKKKFDDIFEATKYTKALDEIKKLRKEQAIEIKVDTERLLALRTDRDRSVKLQTQINRTASKIDVKQSEHADLDEKIRKLSDDTVEFFEQASRHREIINNANALRDRREIQDEHARTIKAGVNELADSDRELQAKLDSFTQVKQAQLEERDELMRKREDGEDGLGSFEKKLNAAQQKHGTLLANQQRHKEVKAERMRIVRELSVRHEIQGFDHHLSEDEMLDFEQKLEAALRDQQRKIDDIKRNARQVEGERQQKVQALKTSQAADERAKKDAVDNIRATKANIERDRRLLEDSAVTTFDVRRLEESVDDERKRQAEASASLNSSDLTNKLGSLARELKEAEERREELHAELASLNTQSEVRAKLALKRTEVKKKDELIDGLLEKHAPAFARETRKEIRRDSFEVEVNAALEVVTKNVVAQDKIVHTAQRELQATETGLTFAKGKVVEVQAKVAERRRQVKDGLEALEDAPHPTVKQNLDEAEEETENARGAVVAASRIGEFFASVISAAKKTSQCSACARPLSSDELTALEKHAARQTRDAPARLAEVEAEFKQWEAQLHALRELLPLEAEHNQLASVDLPEAERALGEQQDALRLAAVRAEQAQDEFSRVKEGEVEMQSLKRSASEVSRLHRETEDLRRDVGKLENELSATGSTATSDEVQSQLHELTDKMRTLKSSIDDANKQRDRLQKLVTNLGDSIHATELELARQKQLLKEKDELERRIETEREGIKDAESRVRMIDERISTAQAPLRREEQALEAIRDEAAQEESAATHVLNQLNQSATKLESNKREIQEYLSRGGDGELDKSARELASDQELIDRSKASLSQLQSGISKLEKAIADSEGIRRNLSDNLNLRKALAEISRIDVEIESLHEEDAQRAARKYETHYHEQRRTLESLQADQARLGGEVETMKADLLTKQHEMDQEYNNIEQRYRTELIKVKTAETANLDLDKYHKALDQAIMSFHSVKMAEINDSIAELWTKTYQGTDIDKIAIKSDAEAKTGPGRSYNYRVVMFKDTTEMDMRGRCSAGQKVLASIIIRLALADSFGASCGILALDEPTTNLDQDNIAALGQALSDLIKVRKEQSNFQLIVITHDEEFLSLLSGSGELDRYWRVTRDISGATSTIERQRLT